MPRVSIVCAVLFVTLIIDKHEHMFVWIDNETPLLS